MLPNYEPQHIDEVMDDYYVTRNDLAHMNEQLVGKRRSRIPIFLWAPYFFILAIIAYPLRWILPPLGKRYSAWLLHYYFRRYFELRGITIDRKPSMFSQPQTTPVLILGMRYHGFSSLFSYQLIPFSVVVPIRRFFHRFRLFRWMPFSIMGPLFKTISYDDAPLRHNMDNIRNILASGRSVLAYINHGHSHLVRDNAVCIFRELGALLALKNVDIYCLHIGGFENYPYAHFFNPILMNADYRSLRDILGNVSASNTDEAIPKLLRFFGYDRFLYVE